MVMSGYMQMTGEETLFIIIIIIKLDFSTLFKM